MVEHPEQEPNPEALKNENAVHHLLLPPTEAPFVGYGLYPYLAVDEQEESVIVIYISGDDMLKAKKYDRYGYPLWRGQAVTLVDTALAFNMDISNLFNQWGAVVSDDNGGAIVFWEDFRNGTFDPEGVPLTNEIYLQRVDSTGQYVFGPNGIDLVQGQQEAGKFNIQWDARDNFGSLAASGLYIYRIKAESKGQTFVKAGR